MLFMNHKASIISHRQRALCPCDMLVCSAITIFLVSLFLISRAFLSLPEFSSFFRIEVISQVPSHHLLNMRIIIMPR